MSVNIKKSIDSEYAEKIAKENMAEYYFNRNIVWDSEIFKKSWPCLDNFDVFFNNKKVGVIRFSYGENSTYIRDLQIESKHQNKGIGSNCLSINKEHANSRNDSFIKLRVFSENPALKLYKNFGFTAVLENNQIIEMEFKLNDVI